MTRRTLGVPSDSKVSHTVWKIGFALGVVGIAIAAIPVGSALFAGIVWGYTGEELMHEPMAAFFIGFVFAIGMAMLAFACYERL